MNNLGWEMIRGQFAGLLAGATGGAVLAVRSSVEPMWLETRFRSPSLACSWADFSASWAHSSLADHCLALTVGCVPKDRDLLQQHSHSRSSPAQPV